MKCANCEQPAHYVYRLTADVGTPYCDKDLPRFLLDRKKAGTLETTEDWEKALQEGLKALAAKSAYKKEPVTIDE
jgi:hypothetical protein